MGAKGGQAGLRRGRSQLQRRGQHCGQRRQDGRPAQALSPSRQCGLWSARAGHPTLRCEPGSQPAVVSSDPRETPGFQDPFQARFNHRAFFSPNADYNIACELFAFVHHHPPHHPVTPLRKMHPMTKTVKPWLAACALAAVVGVGHAQEPVLNLYSARHYATDKALYSGFPKPTGIKINRVDADDPGILARLKTEGAAPPADVILLVDAPRLYKAEVDGLFQPIVSKLLLDAIPAHLRSSPAADGGVSWFGLSTRARGIVYHKTRVHQSQVDSYEALADPGNKGRLCIRSGSHPYNLSLFGAVTEHLGEQKAEAWLKGLLANLARPPKGGDTDQIKAVAAGEC